MEFICTKCNVERGISAKLIEDPKTGELVCPLHPKHRFRVGKTGFLESIAER